MEITRFSTLPATKDVKYTILRHVAPQLMEENSRLRKSRVPQVILKIEKFITGLGRNSQGKP